MFRDNLNKQSSIAIDQSSRQPEQLALSKKALLIEMNLFQVGSTN
ncbi:hypothetical protein [Atopostipes suicloacalis]|nr:hypothetical protein [Atopostipes suicloacalis]